MHKTQIFIKDMFKSCTILMKSPILVKPLSTSQILMAQIYPLKIVIFHSYSRYICWWFENHGILNDFPIIIGNVIIPTDELIFFGGVGIPPTSVQITISLQPTAGEAARVLLLCCDRCRESRSIQEGLG